MNPWASGRGARRRCVARDGMRREAPAGAVLVHAVLTATQPRVCSRVARRLAVHADEIDPIFKPLAAVTSCSSGQPRRLAAAAHVNALSTDAARDACHGVEAILPAFVALPHGSDELDDGLDVRVRTAAGGRRELLAHGEEDARADDHDVVEVDARRHRLLQPFDFVTVSLAGLGHPHAGGAVERRHEAQELRPAGRLHEGHVRLQRDPVKL